MFNQDIIHLYNAVETGVKVHVRNEAESLRVDPENYLRGVELPAKQIDPDEIYGAEAIGQRSGRRILMRLTRTRQWIPLRYRSKTRNDPQPQWLRVFSYIRQG